MNARDGLCRWGSATRPRVRPRRASALAATISTCFATPAAGGACRHINALVRRNGAKKPVGKIQLNGSRSGFRVGDCRLESPNHPGWRRELLSAIASPLAMKRHHANNAPTHLISHAKPKVISTKGQQVSIGKILANASRQPSRNRIRPQYGTCFRSRILQSSRP